MYGVNRELEKTLLDAECCDRYLGDDSSIRSHNKLNERSTGIRRSKIRRLNAQGISVEEEIRLIYCAYREIKSHEWSRPL